MDQPPKNKPTSNGLGANPEEPSLFNVKAGFKELTKDPIKAAKSFGVSASEEALPTISGWAGMGVGARVGGTMGAATGNPLVIAGGALLGGIIGYTIPSIITKFSQDAILNKFVPETFRAMQKTKSDSPYAAKVGGISPLFGVGGVASFSNKAAKNMATKMLPPEALKKMTQEQIVKFGQNALIKTTGGKAAIGAGTSLLTTGYDAVTGKPVNAKEALMGAAESAAVLSLTGNPTAAGRAITQIADKGFNLASRKALIPFADKFINQSWEMEIHKTAVNKANESIRQVEYQQEQIVKSGNITPESIQAYQQLDEAKKQLGLRLRTNQSMLNKSASELGPLQKKLFNAGFDLPNYFSQLSEAQKKGNLAKVINDYRNKMNLQPYTILGETAEPTKPSQPVRQSLMTASAPAPAPTAARDWKDIFREFKGDFSKDIRSSTYTGGALGGGEWKSVAKLISNSGAKISDQIREYKDTLTREGEDTSLFSNDEIKDILDTARTSSEPLKPTFDLVELKRGKQRVPNKSEFYDQNKYYFQDLVKSGGVTLLSNAPSVSTPTAFTGNRRKTFTRSEDLNTLIDTEYQKALEDYQKPKGLSKTQALLQQADAINALPAAPEPPTTIREQNELDAKRAGYLEPSEQKIDDSKLSSLQKALLEGDKKKIKKHPKYFKQSATFKDAVDWLTKNPLIDEDSNEKFKKYVENRYRVEWNAIVGKGSKFGDKLPTSTIKPMVDYIASKAKMAIEYQGLSSLENVGTGQAPSEFVIDKEGTLQAQEKMRLDEIEAHRGSPTGSMFQTFKTGIQGRPGAEPLIQEQRIQQQAFIKQLERRKLERNAKAPVTEQMQAEKMEATRSGEATVSKEDVRKKLKTMSDEELKNIIKSIQPKPTVKDHPLSKFTILVKDKMNDPIGLELRRQGIPSYGLIKPQRSVSKGTVKAAKIFKKKDVEISRAIKHLDKMNEFKKTGEAKAIKKAKAHSNNIAKLKKGGVSLSEIRKMYAGIYNTPTINRIYKNPKLYLKQVSSIDPVPRKAAINKAEAPALSDEQKPSLKDEREKQKPKAAQETKAKEVKETKPKVVKIIKPPKKTTPKLEKIKEEQTKQGKVKKPKEVAPAVVVPAIEKPTPKPFSEMTQKERNEIDAGGVAFTSYLLNTPAPTSTPTKPASDKETGVIPPSSKKAISQKKDINKLADKTLKGLKVVEPLKSTTKTTKPTINKKLKPALSNKTIKKVVKKVNKISQTADQDRINSQSGFEKNKGNIAKINAEKRKKANGLQIKAAKLIKEQEKIQFDREAETNPVLIDAINVSKIVQEWKKGAPKRVYSNFDSYSTDFTNLVDVPEEELRNMKRLFLGKDDDPENVFRAALQKLTELVNGTYIGLSTPATTFTNIYSVLQALGFKNWRAIESAFRTIPNSGSQAVEQMVVYGQMKLNEDTNMFEQTFEPSFLSSLFQSLEKYNQSNEDSGIIIANLYKEWQLRKAEIDEEKLIVEAGETIKKEVEQLLDHAKTLKPESAKKVIDYANKKLESFPVPSRLGRPDLPVNNKKFRFRFSVKQIGDDPTVGLPSIYSSLEKLINIPAKDVESIFETANDLEWKQNKELVKFLFTSGVINRQTKDAFMDKKYYNPFPIIHSDLLTNSEGLMSYLDGLVSSTGARVDIDTQDVLALKEGADIEDTRRDLLGLGDEAFAAKISNWKNIIDMGRINLARSFGIREASLTPTPYNVSKFLPEDANPDLLEAAKFLAFPTTDSSKLQSTSVYVNGRREYWGFASDQLRNVFNPRLVTPDSRILNVLKSAKNLFTISITWAPGFRLGNFAQGRVTAGLKAGETTNKEHLKQHTEEVIKGFLQGFEPTTSVDKKFLKDWSEAQAMGATFGNFQDILRQSIERGGFLGRNGVGALNDVIEDRKLRDDIQRMFSETALLQDMKMGRVNIARVVKNQFLSGLSNLEQSGRIADTNSQKRDPQFIIEQEKFATQKNEIVNKLEQRMVELEIAREKLNEDYSSLKGKTATQRKVINESIKTNKENISALKKSIKQLQIQLSIINPKMYGHNIFPYAFGRTGESDFTQLAGSKIVNAFRSIIPFIGTGTTGTMSVLSALKRGFNTESGRQKKEKKRIDLFNTRLSDLDKKISSANAQMESSKSLVDNLETQVGNAKEKTKGIEKQIKEILKQIKDTNTLMIKGVKVGRKYLPITKARRSKLGDKILTLKDQIAKLDTEYNNIQKYISKEVSDSLVNKLSKAKKQYNSELKEYESLSEFKEDFTNKEKENKEYFEYEKAIEGNLRKYAYWYLATHISVNYLSDLLYELAGDKAKRRYDNLPNYEKYHSLFIPGVDSDYKIPLGFTLQPLARWFVNSSYVVAEEFWSKVDPNFVIDTASRKNMIAELVHAIFSTSEGDGVTFVVSFYQAAEEAFELLSNSGVAKSPNTGQFYVPQNMSMLKPSLQYDSKTMALYKFFAATLAKLGIEQSPMGWQQWTKDFTGKLYTTLMVPTNTFLATVPETSAAHPEGGRFEQAFNQLVDASTSYAFVAHHNNKENRYFGEVVKQFKKDEDAVDQLDASTLAVLVKSGYQISQDDKDYDTLAKELVDNDEDFNTILITQTNLMYRKTMNDYNKWYTNKRNNILLYWPEDTREQGLKKAKELTRLDQFIGNKKLQLVQNYKERKNMILNPNYSGKFTKQQRLEVARMYIDYSIARGLKKQIGVRQ